MATQKQLATHLGLSERQVRNLIKQGILPSGTKGPDLDVCRLAYIDYLRGKATGRVTVKAETELDGEQERARLAHHKANLAALEEQELAGALVRIEDVAEAVGAEYANVRAKLLAMPSKLAPIMLHIQKAAEAQAVLDDAVRDALTELVADEV